MLFIALYLFNRYNRKARQRHEDRRERLRDARQRYMDSFTKKKDTEGG